MKNPSTVYNHLIESYVIFVLNELGILKALSSQDKITTETLLHKVNLTDAQAKAFLQLSETIGIITRQQNEIALSKYGNEIFKMRGFFTWALGGYGNFLKSFGKPPCDGSASPLKWIEGDYVAKGSEECHDAIMSSIIEQELKGFDFSCIADLGCGNAGRLIRFLKMLPESTGIGIDISPKALDSARENVRHAGLESQIQLILGDAIQVLQNHNSLFSHVDCITSFMMFHDIMNNSELYPVIFNRLKTSFPNAKYMFIGDTLDSNPQEMPGDQFPIFTLGFELVHKVQEIKLFQMDDYMKMFASSDVKLIKTLHLGIPNTYLFILKLE